MTRGGGYELHPEFEPAGSPRNNHELPALGVSHSPDPYHDLPETRGRLKFYRIPSTICQKPEVDLSLNEGARSIFRETTHGFASVKVTNSALEVEFVSDSGEPLYQTSVKQRRS